MNQHRLVVSQEWIKNDFQLPIDHQLFKQMTRITRDRGALKHDDALDALSIGVAYWIERMDRDQVMSYNQHKDDLLWHDLDTFMETATGKKPGKPRWIK